MKYAFNKFKNFDSRPSKLERPFDVTKTAVITEYRDTEFEDTVEWP